MVPELVDGTTDTYEATATLSKTILNNDKVTLTLSDYAHNATNIIIHPSDMTFSVASTFFSDKYDFSVDEIDPASNMYTISIYDAKGNVIDPSKLNTYTLNIQLATGLSKSDIHVTLDGELASESDYSYDAATGILTVTIKKGVSSIQLSHKPQANGGSSDSSSSSSTTPDSSVTPDSSSSSTDSSSSSSSSETKKGCFGSVIGTSSVIAALGLVGAGLALKKKKEEK